MVTAYLTVTMIFVTFTSLSVSNKSKQIIMISSSLSLCSPFYSLSIKGINTKLGILAQHDKIQWQDKGHNSESYIFGVMPLF